MMVGGGILEQQTPQQVLDREHFGKSDLRQE